MEEEAELFWKKQSLLAQQQLQKPTMAQLLNQTPINLKYQCIF